MIFPRDVTSSLMVFGSKIERPPEGPGPVLWSARSILMVFLSNI